MAKKSSLFKTVTTIVTLSALTLSVAVGAILSRALRRPKFSSGETEVIDNSGNGGDYVAKSIDRIENTASYGQIDEYTIFYTDDTTSTFIVTNGVNGQDGEPGIQGFPGVDGHTPEIKIGTNGNWFIDGLDTGEFAQGPQGEPGITPHIGSNGNWWIGEVDTEVQAIGRNGKTPLIGANGHWWIGGTDTGVSAYGQPGPQGEQGPAGRGIQSIEKTDTQGLIDTYTITYTDGTTSEFLVTNGANGETAAQGLPGQDGRTPVITIGSNGNWFVDGVDTEVAAQGPQGPQGEQGQAGNDGLSLIPGEGEPTAALGKNGDSYVDTQSWNYYVKENDAWVLKGNIKGESNAGNNGLNGKSAYEIAVDNGYTGTEAEWLASLIGEAGANGDIGNNGKSAYELAVENGFTGTEEQWLTTLIGPEGAAGAAGQDGKSVYELAVENGFTGSLDEWLTSLVGEQGQQGQQGQEGKSAYELAVENGYTGTLEQWLTSLAGEDGVDGVDGVNGKSAYDLAVEHGFSGTEEEWLASLIGQDGAAGATGQDGKSAYELAVENGFSGTITEWMDSLIGQDGADGSALRTGNGEPENDLGLDGDSFVDLESYNFYVKEDGAWVLKGNIKGANGLNGISIVSVEKTNTEGLVDTYTITYSDGNTTTFTVTNGVQGQDGNTLLVGTGAPTSETTANVGDSYIDVETWKLYVKGEENWTDKGSFKGDKGDQGEQGEQGVSITDIAYDSSSGLVDTYLISYSDGTNDTFAVTNGQDGTSLKTGYGNPNIASVDDPATTEDETRDDPVTGIEGDSFLDLHSWDYYVLEEGSEGLEWVFKGNIHNVNETYEITFNTNGGSTAPETQTVGAGYTIDEPDDPTKEDWIFQGWYTTDGTRWEFDKDVASHDMELEAHWAKFKVVNGVLVECTATGGVVIPEFFNDQLVTGIAPEVFKDKTEITSVELPYTLTTIGESAFEGCTGLTSLVVPHNVRFIGDNAFKDCSGVTYIYFAGNSSSSGFAPVSGVNSFNFFGLSIGNSAFENCSSLKALDIPESVSYIGSNVFKGCTSINSLSVYFFGDGADNQFIGYIFGASSFTENISTVPASLKTVTYKGNNAIANYAMGGCENVKNIIIADTPSSIGLGAFEGCDGLTAIELPYVGSPKPVAPQNQGSTNPNPGTPSGDYNYGSGAPTAETQGLVYADIENKIIYVKIEDDWEPFVDFSTAPDELLSLIAMEPTAPDLNNFGYYLYYDYVNGNIYLDGDMDGVLDYAGDFIQFIDAINGGGGGGGGGGSQTNDGPMHLGYIFGAVDYYDQDDYIPVGLRTVIVKGGSGNNKDTIGDRAFFGCYMLTKIELPDTIRTIGELAFGSCNNIESIVIPDNVSTIGDGAFSYCSNLKTIVLPSALTAIPDQMFYYCTFLETVNIPNNVSEIGASAFSNCNHLKYLVFPDSVLSIGYSTFEGCISLETVVLPKLLKSINSRMFYNCNHLKNIVINDNVETIGELAFYYCSALTTIVVPNSVTEIGSNAFWCCSSLETLSIPFVGKQAGTPSEEREGRLMWYFNSSSNADGSVPNSLKKVIVTGDNGKTVTSIYDKAFYGCTKIEQVILPEGITSIGTKAFGDNVSGKACASLSSINLPDSLLTIGDYAFGWTGLTSIVIPKNMTEIGNGVFFETELATVVIPGSITHVGDRAFFGCDKLHVVEMATGEDKTFGEYCFYNCSNLEYVIFGGGITNIQDGLFNGRKSLKSVVLPDTLVSVGKEAFQGCEKLLSITFPESTKYIYEAAFKDCIKMQTINFNTGLLTIHKNAFRDCMSLAVLDLPTTVKAVGIGAFAMYRGNDLTSALNTICLPLGINRMNNILHGQGETMMEDDTYGEDLDMYINTTNGNLWAKFDGKWYFQYSAGIKYVQNTEPTTANGCGWLEPTSGMVSVKTYGLTAFVEIETIKEFFYKPGFMFVYLDQYNSENHALNYYYPQGVNYCMQWSSFLQNINRLVLKEGRVMSSGGYYAVSYTNIRPHQFKWFNYSSHRGFDVELSEYLSAYPSIAIEKGAFEGCSTLERIELPSAGEGREIDQLELSDDLFKGCSSLRAIEIPLCVSSVGNSCFEDCRSLNYVIFEEGAIVRKIGINAFKNCSSLKSIVLPDSVLEIHNFAFNGCYNLTSAVISSNLELLGNGVFSECPKLETLVAPMIGAHQASFDDSYSYRIWCDKDSGPIDLTSNVAPFDYEKRIYYWLNAKSGDLWHFYNDTWILINNIKQSSDKIIYGYEAYQYGTSRIDEINDNDGNPNTHKFQITSNDGLDTTYFIVDTGGQTQYFKESNGKLQINDFVNYTYDRYDTSTSFYSATGYFKVGFDGYLVIGHCCSSTLVRGPSGADIPVLTIENGKWFVDGVDTEIRIFPEIGDLHLVYNAHGGDELYGEIYYYSGKSWTGYSNSYSRALFSMSISSIGFAQLSQWFGDSDYSSLKTFVATNGDEFIAGYPTVSINSEGYIVVDGKAIATKVTGLGGHMPRITLNRYLFWEIDGVTMGYKCNPFGNGVTPPALSITEIDDEDGDESTHLYLIETFEGQFSKFRTDSDFHQSFYLNPNIDHYFEGCTNLETIVLGPSVKEILDNSFEGFTNLKSITLPSTLTKIGKSAFKSCTSLESIIIPNSVSSIGDMTFANCASLKEFNFPTSLTDIGTSAFEDCINLREVSFSRAAEDPAKVDIGNNAFKGCTTLIKVINGRAIKTLGSYAFVSCEELENINLSNCTAIGDYAFKDCACLRSVIMPTSSSYTSVGTETFSNCYSLSGIKLSSYVTEIGTGAFENCYSITTIDLRNVKNIKESAFQGCSSLDIIHINIGNETDGYLQIESNAFLGCDAMTTIYIWDITNGNDYNTWRDSTNVSGTGNKPIKQANGNGPRIITRGSY